MPIGEIVSAVGSIAGAVISGKKSSKAAKKQADTMAEAQKYAADLQWKQYQQNREDLAPWREAGGRALKQLQSRVAAGPGDYTQSPGYEFAFNEGLRALNRNYAKSGALGSGAHKKALIQYGQGMAANDYDRYLNRYYQSLQPLQYLEGTGRGATNTTAQLGAQTAANVGQQHLNSMADVAALQRQAADYRNSGFVNALNLGLGGLNQLSGLSQLGGGTGAGYAGVNYSASSGGGPSGYGGVRYSASK